MDKQMDKQTKLFTIAGTALSPEGRERFCVSNDKVHVRAYKLRFHGCTAVELEQLPEPMTLEQAKAWIHSQRAERAAAAAAAAKKADFVARMAAARAAKKAAAAD